KIQNLFRNVIDWMRRRELTLTSRPKFRRDAPHQLIANDPPVREAIEVPHVAVERLGKVMVDVANVSVSFDEHQVLRNITWRIGPGERTGILGANGAGKSTLLGLVTGDVQPTTGRVKHGKTVQIGILDQQFSQLQTIGSQRVREVLAET